MSDRTDYFLQILSTIGAPLMRAIVTKGDGQGETTAQHMAELLTKSVEASIELGPLVELDKLGEQADSVRVALAGLSSQVLADLYQDKGSVPEAAELKRIRDGFQAVISFADNFTASKDAVMRLEALDAGGHAVDETQSQVQYIKSFVPVIRAVAEFSFGKPGPQLLGDIAAKISNKAQDIRKAQFGDTGSDDDHKRIERGLVQSLATLYAGCHEAETQRLSGSDDQGGASIDKVWEAFDLQVQILEALVQSIVPGGAPVQVEAATPAPAEAPAEPPPPAAETPAPPPAEAPPASGGDSGGGNPMSFFSKGDDDKAEDSAPETPAAEPPPAATEPPTAPPPVEQQPAEEDKDEDSSDKGSSGDSGNPMSFFKKD